LFLPHFLLAAGDAITITTEYEHGHVFRTGQNTFEEDHIKTVGGVC